jgi:mersacidin/lichenicidin family type 2 lantibiotic
MSQENIIRSWKDETFRQQLSERERNLLPAHPAGAIELTDAELENIAGARPTTTYRGSVCTGGTIWT